MSKKDTRVMIYSELRDKIDKMDTLSFDDPDRDKKYGLNGEKAVLPVHHEEAMSSQELKTGHIKKNTLSISIDELIKQNDDYTMALEKKELNKKYKNMKKEQHKARNKKLAFYLGIAGAVIVIAAAIIICVILSR
ncbi:MAG: hypothetical protein PHQ11_16985 [Paludibacter sp.]|nr:hypothetical protein [Paludibacter sp.]MDD4531930.1 hypothetical protein [Bacilli bacterium]